MRILTTIWQEFKKNLDVWFFYGFLLTFTLSVRKIISFFPIKGNFNEYTAISIYLSDIFLILTLIAWGITILCNEYTSLSMFISTVHSLYNKKVWITCWERLKCSTLARNKIVPRGTILGGWNIFKRKLLFIPLLLIIWAFVSIIWSDNKIIAFYRSAKFLEYYLMFIYIVFRIIRTNNCSTWNNCREQPNNVPRGTILTKSNILTTVGILIIAIGLFQGIIGIWQFIIQRSVGILWLKESIISPETLGVAKVVIGSEIYIRAYGLFPHPNILGGFLLISIILTILYKTLFRACPANCSTWNNWTKYLFKIVPHVPSGMFHMEHSNWGGTIWLILLSIQVLALILTFSKSAILGIIFALTYIFINQARNVPRPSADEAGGTIIKNDTKMFHVEQFKKYFILSFLVFGFLLFYFKIDLYTLFIQSLEERLLYLTISIKAIVSHIFIGLGNGQFVMEMQKYASVSLEFWQYQPVHNVFLLILSELGIIGLFLFVWFLLELFHVKQFGSTRAKHVEKQNRESILRNVSPALSSSLISTYFKAILLGIIFIMLFDHYFWDIQQGQIMLWMLFGALATFSTINR